MTTILAGCFSTVVTGYRTLPSELTRRALACPAPAPSRPPSPVPPKSTPAPPPPPTSPSASTGISAISPLLWTSAAIVAATDAEANPEKAWAPSLVRRCHPERERGTRVPSPARKNHAVDIIAKESVLGVFLALPPLPPPLPPPPPPPRLASRRAMLFFLLLLLLPLLLLLLVLAAAEPNAVKIKQQMQLLL